MRTFEARPAAPDIHILAEGPVWDAPRQRLIWVDVSAGTVHLGVLEGESIRPYGVIEVDETVGAVTVSPVGDLLVAGHRSLVTIRPDGSRTTGPQLIPDGRNSRLNDGGCDPAGRFLIGSLPLDDREGEEQLLHIGATGEITVIDDDLSLSNGLAWSPDGGTFYSTDTTPGIIHKRSYDAENGRWGPRSTHLQITDGSPDGLCADRDGNLWIAIWGEGQVRCYASDGDVLATVTVPAPNTSCVAFAGPDLDVLVITTASEQLTRDQLGRFPHSGKLFTCRVGTTGLPVPMWSTTR